MQVFKNSKDGDCIIALGSYRSEVVPNIQSEPPKLQFMARAVVCITILSVIRFWLPFGFFASLVELVESLVMFLFKNEQNILWGRIMRSIMF